MESQVPFQTSHQFAALPAIVQEKFTQENDIFKVRLMQTDLYSYFLTDELRGPNVIRAYLETNKFEMFSGEDRLYGAGYVGLCNIFQVNMTF